MRVSYNNIYIICHHVIRIYFIVIVINRTCRQYTEPRLTSRRLRHAAQHFTLNQYLRTHTTHYTFYIALYFHVRGSSCGYLINIKLIHMLSQHSPTNFLPLTLRLEIQHDTCTYQPPTQVFGSGCSK